MKKEIFISIDDTDEIGFPKSTGLLAQEIVEFIEQNFSPCKFISRHQLLLDDRINYTSHNSSMCFSTKLEPKQKDEVALFIENHLKTFSAKSAQPAFAIAFKDEIINIDGFIEFGKKAKEEYISLEEAYNIAKKHNIFLKGIENGFLGAIGALAGLALRVYGDDGRVKGQNNLKKDSLSKKELLSFGFIDDVLDENFAPLSDDCIVKIKSNIKLIVKNHKAVLLTKKCEDNSYKAYDIDSLRKF